jgi:uncharacterized membrane protein YbhN (UPF0104 family)
MRRSRHAAWHWLASLLLVALAAVLLWRQLHGLSLRSLGAAVQALPASALAASLVATALSFACLAGYERMATQWIAPGKIPREVAWRVGLEAHALANTLGFHALTAVALRLRTYAAHGIDAATLAKIVAATGGCVATGVVAIVLSALAWTQWLAGRAGMLLAIALFLGAAIAVLGLRLQQFLSRSPVLAHAGRLALVGLLEMAAAAAALWVLVPAGALPPGPWFVLLFVSAQLLGIVSHAPGGLGVFEAAILSAAAPSARTDVFAALLAYRLLYNLLPCALALLAIGIGWARGRHREPRASSTVDSGA